ncbi:hypothetical protein [Parapedobacter sp. 10938]|uniref:hypothetical protein n=1 Tax=Parapedobacter flavus TaxID=3110225 RepID=UPI002DBEA302|nr:hypothetical protein [Parapedobacter sp. 10938]MEC3880520.1 hypothetical protein [Parapedobacter sp. 10938]
MKKIYVVLMALLMVLSAGQSGYAQSDKRGMRDAVRTMEQFRKTSPFVLDDERLRFLNTFQVYADSLEATTFKAYLNKPEAEVEQMEAGIPMIYCYREAFDKVLHEVKNTKVKEGTALVWLLYNMGFVVKTPSGCFGIDVEHRLAEQLAPYLDFIGITHNHGDHAHVKLMEAMTKAGKPVITNFYKGCAEYRSTTATSYQVGNFTIRTDISSHLRNPKLPDFVMSLRIDCGDDAGNFSLLSCGDSGFESDRFANVQGDVDLLVLRWGAPRENDIIGTGPGLVNPRYAVLSHLIELRHEPKGQASITQTLKHLPGVNCENTLLPFWGEQFVWADGKLQ